MKTKLQIFKEVAKQLSFTKASAHLFLSQPAVSKAIKSIESEYKKTLFLREGNSIRLTEDGQTFLSYAEQILTLYAQLENAFLNVENKDSLHLTFGASSTLTQYILPQIIAKAKKNAPYHTFEIKNGNSQQIEELIINQDIDFGLIEGGSNNIRLQYKEFVKDEIVLVTNSSNNQIKSDTIKIADLANLPMVEREIGSGTREIISKNLFNHQIKKLNTSLIFSSPEAIKNYLLNAPEYYALLSIHSVYKELSNNELKIIDINNLTFERVFHFVSRQGFQSKKMQYFEKLMRQHYNF